MMVRVVADAYKVYKHQDHPKNLGSDTKDIQKYDKSKSIEIPKR